MSARAGLNNDRYAEACTFRHGTQTPGQPMGVGVEIQGPIAEFLQQSVVFSGGGR